MSAPLERTDEWFEARRAAVSSTDLPAILGVSRWSSEGDIAREKAGAVQEVDAETERRFRLGLALQEAIRVEEELEHGVKLRRVKRLQRSREVPWAVASLDFVREGERCIVEAKTSASREWRDGLPEAVEAQVRWQMGVARYPRAHVAALLYGTSLACFDLEHDDKVWRNLLLIAGDFRRRLEAGGPFEETRESGRRAWPADDGSAMLADHDPELVAAVRDLFATRRNLEQVAAREDALVAAIQARMGPATTLTGPGFKVTWRRSADSLQTNWQGLAEGLLREKTEEEREVLTALHRGTKEGTRRFIARDLSEREDER